MVNSKVAIAQNWLFHQQDSFNYVALCLRINQSGQEDNMQGNVHTPPVICRDMIPALGKALPFISLLYALAYGVPVNAADYGGPVQLIPGNTMKEEQLTTVTIPPASSFRPDGLSESMIHGYFDDEPLSADARRTLNAISNHWEQEKRDSRNQPVVTLQHKFSAVGDKNTSASGEEKQKAAEISLSPADKVSAKPVTVGELQVKAYDALISGQMEIAISLYKQALKLKPDDRLSMFGLATTYHRNGQIKQARALYSEILQKYPNDRDTMNNFLALISMSSPTEALAELQKLEYANPHFSPIAAQMGMIYQRMGNDAMAIQYLMKAIRLSPQNLSYRYNLAIMLDSQNRRPEAATLYRQLLAAADAGATLPADRNAIYNRLAFITTER